MRIIYLIRHGQTNWNSEQRFQGHMDIPLNDTGRSQAKALVPTLLSKGIEALLSSDLSRAVETAQIIATELQIPHFQDAGLREAHLGDAQGLTVEEIEKKFGLALLKQWRSPDLSYGDISYPGGETGNQVILRSLKAIQDFFEVQVFSRVAVATHGGVIRRLMNHFLPPGSPSIPIPNGIVYTVHYDEVKRAFSV